MSDGNNVIYPEQLGRPHGFNGDGYSVPDTAGSVNVNHEANPNGDKPLSPAAQTLYQAALLIDGERDDQHGAREICHGEIAKVWTWWTGTKIEPHDVAVMMALLKVARIKTGGHNPDCYTDLCGYGAIAGELVK